jgi:hypothetical protein
MKKVLVLLLLLTLSAGAVTPQDYMKVIKQIKQCVDSNDKEKFKGLFSQRKVIERIRTASEPKNLKGFRGFINGLMSNFGSVVSALHLQTKTGSFEFLHKVKRPKGEFWIFRMEGDGGINYFEFMLIEENNAVKIADYYIYITGQYFTETAAILYKNFEGQTNAAEISTQAGMMKKIQTLILQKKFKEALVLYKKFPEDLKKLKVMKAIKMTIAMNLDEKLYVETIEDLMKHYGDTDRGYIMLVQVDFWFLKENYKKVLECINGLDKYLKGDPFLEIFRMNSYFLMEDFEGTLKAAENYAKVFEAGSDVYTIPFTLGIKMKDHKRAVKGLKFMYSGDFYIEDLEKDPDYKEFVASDEYKKFKKSNKHPNDK